MISKVSSPPVSESGTLPLGVEGKKGPSCSNLRVALWSTSYFKGFGGAEKVVHDLLNHFDGLGLATFLIADKPSMKRVSVDWFSPLNPRIIVYQNTFPNPLLFTNRPLLFLYKTIQYVKASVLFGFFVLRNRIQVVHLHLVNVDVLLLILYKWLFKYRLVLTFTGLELELSQQNRFSRLKIRLALKAADAVTAVSNDICDRLRYLFNASEVRCIQNGIHMAETRAAPDGSGLDVAEDHFVYCGRLTSIKRPLFLLRAFHEALRQGCQKKLYIIGDGEELNAMVQFVQQHGLADHVIFLGALSHREAMAVVKRSRCLVLPSESEGCPMVVLEAMALGRPVIASDVGGLSEVVSHGKNGLLFPAENLYRFCDLILKMAREKDLAIGLGARAAQTIASRFRFETMANQYLSVYTRDHQVGAHAD